MCADRLRLFVAADIPLEVRRAIDDATTPLKAKVPGGKWVKAENLHITLKFIGEYKEEGLGRLSDEILEVAKRFAPFEICLGGCGAFPAPARARVLWMGMTEGGKEAAMVAKKLDAKLERAGVKREGRDYRGHVTIARLKDPVDCRTLLEELAACVSGLGRLAFRVEGLKLYRSVLGSSGPGYKTLREFTFGGGVGGKD